MTSDKRIRRLPGGSFTRKSSEYIEAWSALGLTLEKEFGWRLMAFDPDFQFDIHNGRTITLPLDAVLSIVNRVRERDDALSAIEAGKIKS